MSAAAYALEARLTISDQNEPVISLPENATDAEYEILRAWVAAWRAPDAAKEKINALIDERLRDPVTIKALTTALIRRAARERLVSTGQ